MYGQFRSRDRDSGHIIRFTMAENFMLLAGYMARHRKGVIADRNFTLREWGFSTIFAPVTLTR